MNRTFLPLVCVSLLALPAAVVAEGLIYKLPPDGAWARYEVESRQGEVAMPKGSVTISSVGTENVGGERCRWLEVAIRQPHPQQGSSQVFTMVFKLLIPEAHIGYQRDPLKHVVRLWRTSVTDTGEPALGVGEVPDPTGPHSSSFLIAPYLHGPYEKAMKLPAVAVDCKAGKFDCTGYQGERSFSPGMGAPVNAKGLFKIRVNREVPFGVVSLAVELQVERDGKALPTVVQTLMLVEMGDEAKPLLILPADVTDIPDDAEAAVRLIAPRAASARDGQSWNVISRSEQPLKLEVASDQPLALLIRNLPLEKEVPEAQKAEFEWLAQQPKRADLALVFQPVKAPLISPLQPSYISKVTADVTDDTATGQISFHAEGAYRGNVEYTARRGDGRWAIVEFRLPAHKLKTSLNDKGLWKIAALESPAP